MQPNNLLIMSEPTRDIILPRGIQVGDGYGDSLKEFVFNILSPDEPACADPDCAPNPMTAIRTAITALTAALAAIDDRVTAIEEGP